MFDNIGGKIKKLATICTIVGIVISVILGVISMFESFFGGLLAAGIGSLASWVGSFLLYGFGELVENSQIVAMKIGKPQAPTQAASQTSANSNQVKVEEPVKNYLANSKTPLQGMAKKTCPYCYEDNDETETVCKRCGKRFD